ncbi:hypothetical protein HQQ94_17125 [Shewanella sp. VB17]|uniref:hypothetical protein n=1 Tax=Shewanella sp. VB17 TaxID=2739432 RepID=UPI001563FBDF|nr:hypothetical protein [Shewanella sp. VB17]NRD74906.1 hypothetical protein [Shewanella sp. VB17]
MFDVKDKKNSYMDDECQVNVKLISQSRDLIAYYNIEAWSKRLYDVFEKSMFSKINPKKLSINSEIEVLVNNYTFMLSFKGEHVLSRKMLETVIDFWVARYLETKNNDFLIKVLQPTVNLARLHVLNNNYDEFYRIVEELNNDNGFITLGAITINDYMIADHISFIKNVMFLERLKINLKKKNGMLTIDSECPPEMLKSIFYRESQIIFFLVFGHYQQAESIIRGVMYRTSGVEQNIFYYRLYESYMCQGKYENAKEIINDIVDDLLYESLDNLKVLMFSSLIIKTARLPPSAKLSVLVLEKYQLLGDEMNYFDLLMWFYKNFETDEVKYKLYEIYKISHYDIVRRTIAFNFDLNGLEVDSTWSDILTSKLNSFFMI